MACCHYYAVTEDGEDTFTVNANTITFGKGCLREAGDLARSLGIGRIALFTDRQLAATPHVAAVKRSLADAGIDVALYDEVRIEPTDISFKAATDFAREGNFEGFISVGGGSVIDTTKAANLYSTHPADFLTYVNAPIGGDQQPPGSLKPHIACPTTSGTGSECTGIAVFDLLEMKAKTSIVSNCLRLSLALVDPSCTHTMPRNVIAASVFDVLSHALESYTARPFTMRPAPKRPSARPASQGANPWSDLGCREALNILGKYLVRAVTDDTDNEAREQLMWAATLAGIAFGNSGVHVPHGMSYSVAGLVRNFYPDGYPKDAPICPHGMSVIVNAPAVFRFTAPACADRHLAAARWLGSETRGASDGDAGEVLSERLIDLMKATDMPNGIGGVGYGAADIVPLTDGAFPQRRLLHNAPLEISKETLSGLFEGAMSYW